MNKLFLGSTLILIIILHLFYLDIYNINNVINNYINEDQDVKKILLEDIKDIKSYNTEDIKIINNEILELDNKIKYKNDKILLNLQNFLLKIINIKIPEFNILNFLINEKNTLKDTYIHLNKQYFINSINTSNDNIYNNLYNNLYNNQNIHNDDISLLIQIKNKFNIYENIQYLTFQIISKINVISSLIKKEQHKNIYIPNNNISEYINLKSNNILSDIKYNIFNDLMKSNNINDIIKTFINQDIIKNIYNYIIYTINIIKKSTKHDISKDVYDIIINIIKNIKILLLNDLMKSKDINDLIKKILNYDIIKNIYNYIITKILKEYEINILINIYQEIEEFIKNNINNNDIIKKYKNNIQNIIKIIKKYINELKIFIIYNIKKYFKLILIPIKQKIKENNYNRQQAEELLLNELIENTKKYYINNLTSYDVLDIKKKYNEVIYNIFNNINTILESLNNDIKNEEMFQNKIKTFINVITNFIKENKKELIKTSKRLNQYALYMENQIENDLNNINETLNKLILNNMPKASTEKTRESQTPEVLQTSINTPSELNEILMKNEVIPIDIGLPNTSTEKIRGGHEVVSEKLKLDSLILSCLRKSKEMSSQSNSNIVPCPISANYIKGELKVDLGVDLQYNDEWIYNV